MFNAFGNTLLFITTLKMRSDIVNKQNTYLNELMEMLKLPETEIDDAWLFDDDDFEDDLLDERYDPDSLPLYKFTFYQALEELKFQHENEKRNTIWYVTNGERVLTFKDERLVDVRLADCIENLVYFSAPIQLKDLSDEWQIGSVIDEEAQKIDKIVELAETLKDEDLARQLLHVIGLHI